MKLKQVNTRVKRHKRNKIPFVYWMCYFVWTALYYTQVECYKFI